MRLRDTLRSQEGNGKNFPEGVVLAPRGPYLKIWVQVSCKMLSLIPGVLKEQLPELSTHLPTKTRRAPVVGAGDAGSLSVPARLELVI